MKRALSIILVLLVFASTAYAQPHRFNRLRRIPREQNTFPQYNKDAGFELLFDGKDIDENIWQGATKEYKVVDGAMVCDPGGNILTKKEYKDFVFRFQFKLPPAGNNGVGIHTKMGVNAAYDGYEIQILDDTADVYKDLKPYQFHGSVYRFVPAKQGSLRPVGEWNDEEIIVYGNKIRVVCNGQTIVDADMTDFINGTEPCLDTDNPNHTFNETGLVGFLGHGDPVAFKNVKIKEIKSENEYKALIAPGPKGNR
ncbi:MAG: 3-keto-disaccharide hydrolase [Thermoguttaceae bacterium]